MLSGSGFFIEYFLYVFTNKPSDGRNFLFHLYGEYVENVNQVTL